MHDWLTLKRFLQKIFILPGDIFGKCDEILWANIFHDTIKSSTWLHGVPLSPGRWAVGYPYLYVLYRVLNELRPKSILDIGLGTSTDMISAYAAHVPEARHVTVEASAEWIAFYKKNRSLSPRTEIMRLPYCRRAFCGMETRQFEGFEDALRGQKFDVISVDAPSNELKADKIGRVDLIHLIPECLAEQFVILCDDSHTACYRRAAKLLTDTLRRHGIDHKLATYSGDKQFTLVVSKDLGFLCSL